MDNTLPCLAQWKRLRQLSLFITLAAGMLKNSIQSITSISCIIFINLLPNRQFDIQHYYSTRSSLYRVTQLLQRVQLRPSSAQQVSVGGAQFIYSSLLILTCSFLSARKTDFYFGSSFFAAQQNVEDHPSPRFDSLPPPACCERFLGVITSHCESRCRVYN